MRLIDTPYGKKTPKLVCEAMDAHMLQPTLLNLLRRSLQALHEDDFPQLRDDIREALENVIPPIP